jgi:hypothetical protein
MTLQIKPGHDLSDDELLRLEALIQQAYPDDDLEIVYEDAPDASTAYVQTAPAEKPPGFLQRIAVLGITGVAGLYLINPTAGVLEFIPDVIPVVGNLDEATALALFISGLSYFGVNVGWLSTIFGRGLSKRKRD